MKHILSNIILLLATIGVAAIARAQHRRGVYAPLAAWWRGASRLMRCLVTALVLTAVAYGADKILGGHIGEGRRTLGGAVASLCTNVFTTCERLTGYAISSAKTNETHDLAIPENAQLAERIARHGAHDDGFWYFDAYTNRLTRDGLDLGNPVWIHTDGTVTLRSPAPGVPIQELAQTSVYSNITVYAPLQGSYGFLPASKWPDFMPSLIWTAMTDKGSRVVTWEGALLERDVSRPVSFQAEFHENGEVTYRYNPAQTNYVGIGLFRNGAALTFGLSDLQDLLTFQDPSATNNPSTLQPFNLSTLKIAYIGDLSDGSGDTDTDGLTDWEEVKHFHTDPQDADTDGDGLVDGEEVAVGTNPFDFDTDRDGLADFIDQEPLTSCGNAYGQSDLWIAATFTNAAEVIDMGYTNYIQSVLSGTNGFFHYTLTVTVEALDSEGRALIRVGDQYVVVNGLGEYDFLLDIGPEYPIGITPHGGATFAASDDRAEITAPTNDTKGMIAVRADGVSVNPSWQHYSAIGESHSFTASIDGAAPSVDGEWQWSCEDSGVQILSPTSRTTDIAWNWQAGGNHDTWETAEVSVRCNIGHWAATNTITLHCGSHQRPQVSFGINVPRAFFATNGADVVVSFHSDIPTNGTISVADTSLASVLEEGPPWNWTFENTRDLCVTNRIRGSGPSIMADDIIFETTLTLQGASPEVQTSTTTAVVLNEIKVSSAPNTGLVVLAGSSVPMMVTCLPSGADLSEAETDWFLGRKRSDNSHDNWQKVATNETGVAYLCPFPTGGVYRIRADVSLAGGKCNARFWRFSFDPILDLPNVVGYGYVGVATTEAQIRLRQTALAYLGDTRFAYAKSLPSYYGFSGIPFNKNKCNAFVAYCICETGLTIPRRRSLFGSIYPPTANHWAYGVNLGDWAHLATNGRLEPGLVIGFPDPADQGHCGIVDFDGLVIAAGKKEVNRRFADFLDGSSGLNRWQGEVGDE